MPLPTIRADERRRNVALLVAVVHDGRPRYQIAAAATINANTFGAILAGRTLPTEAVQHRIADALGLSVGALFGDDAYEATP